MTNSFSIREAIGFGWKTVKSHSALVFQVVLTLLAAQVAGSIVQRVLIGTALGTLAYLVLLFIQIYVGVGALYVSLKLARGEHATYNQIWPDWHIVWRYFWSSVLAGLAMVAPILISGILIIGVGLSTLGSFIAFSEGQSPALGAAGGAGIVAIIIIAVIAVAFALYIGLRYSMARFEVLDGARVVESLRKSAIITRGHKWKLFGFIILLMLLNLLGAILLLVGLLVTIPITMIAMAHVYTKLRAHHHVS